MACGRDALGDSIHIQYSGGGTAAHSALGWYRPTVSRCPGDIGVAAVGGSVAFYILFSGFRHPLHSAERRKPTHSTQTRGICATKSPQKQKVAAPSCASTPPPPHHTHMVQADTGAKLARRRALPCPGRPAWHRWALAPRTNACRNRVEAVLRQGLAQVHFGLKFYWC